MTTRPPELIQVSPARAWLPVRVAATVNVALTNSPDAVNGITLGPERDRVLLTAQSTGAQNGIYELTASGADTVLTIDPDETTTETVTIGRLVYVTVTGTVTVTGVNGVVTEGNPAFLSPLTGPTRLGITGGEDGGTVTYKAAVGLARVADADANGDFVAGKIVDVRQGTNAGIWNLQGPATLVISNSVATVFTRSYQADQAALDPTAAFTSVAPAIKPLGFAIAIVTSLGALTHAAGRVSGLI